MELKAIIASIAAFLHPTEKVTAPDTNDSPFQRDVLAVHKDYRLETLPETDLKKPLRTRGTAVFHQYDAFVSYVLHFSQPGARIFIEPSLDFRKGGKLATAYLDHPIPGDSRWSTHHAELVVATSLEYELLTQLDGKMSDQSDFATQLQQIARFCTTMSAADLLEVARTLRLTSAGKFSSIEDKISGSIDLGYEVAVKATAGTTNSTLSVPTHLGFHVPLLLGGTPVDVTAEMRYRIPDEPGGKVKLGIVLPDRKFIEHDFLVDLVSMISSNTGLPAAVGTTSVPSSDRLMSGS